MIRDSSRRRSVLLGVAALGMAAGPAMASDYQLEFSLRGEGDSRPFVYRATLERTVADDMARGDSAAVQEQLQAARKAYADKKGYREAVYGSENWKMVRIDDWTWKIVDGSSGRVSGSGSRTGGS